MELLRQGYKAGTSGLAGIRVKVKVTRPDAWIKQILPVSVTNRYMMQSLDSGSGIATRCSIAE